MTQSVIWSQGAETESSECFLILCISVHMRPFSSSVSQLCWDVGLFHCCMAVWISTCFDQSSSEKRCNDIQMTPLFFLLSVCVILCLEQIHICVTRLV